MFVQRFDHGHTIASHLQCSFYRGSTDKTITDQDRQQFVSQWRLGERKVMVATDAFGPGNDYPHIRKVYIFGCPKGLVDFTQCVGRAGRDHDIASIHLFILSSPTNHSAHGSTPLSCGSNELQQLISENNTKCWREIISQFLDGAPASCSSSPYNLPCPVCSTNTTHLPSPWYKIGDDAVPIRLIPILPPPTPIPPPTIQLGNRRPRSPSDVNNIPPAKHFAPSTSPSSTTSPFKAPMEQARVAAHHRHSKLTPLIDELKASLRMFTAQCPLCYIMRQGPSAARHNNFLTCPSIPKVRTDIPRNPQWSAAPFVSWVKTIRYTFNSGVCYKCHVPFFNDKLHPAVDMNNQCNGTYKDIIPPIAYWAYFTLHIRSRLSQHFHQQWPTEQAYVQWLSATHPEYPVPNMVMVFLWVIRDVSV